MPLFRTHNTRQLNSFRASAVRTLQRAFRKRAFRAAPKRQKFIALNTGKSRNKMGLKSYRLPNPFSIRSSTGRLVVTKPQLTLANTLSRLGFYKRARTLLPKARAFDYLKRKAMSAKLRKI